MPAWGKIILIVNLFAMNESVIFKVLLILLWFYVGYDAIKIYYKRDKSLFTQQSLIKGIGAIVIGIIFTYMTFFED